jgi:hypothetical protein
MLDETPAEMFPMDQMDAHYLHFVGPDNKKAVIWITRGPTTQYKGQNVWHFDGPKDGVITVSPSVHYIGSWHSPNPVKFRITNQKGA